jgi:hypothetical protein
MSKLRRPSPGLVVAVAALILALSAPAIAARLITGKQIKDGSIGLKDLSASARAKLRGVRGPAGPPGPAGAAGATGARGPAGAPGATNVVMRTASLDLTGPNVVSTAATCNAGERVVGGGARVSESGGTSGVVGSGPAAGGLPAQAGQTPDGWFATGRNSQASEATLTVYVLCASP